MKLDAVRALCDDLEAACQQAEAEGRDELLETDLGVMFAGLDEARAELAAAIARNSGK